MDESSLKTLLRSIETITKSRQPYTDKEAIYYLVPSKESVSRFIDDFTKKGPGWNKGAMYAGAHIYFTGGNYFRQKSYNFKTVICTVLTPLYRKSNLKLVYLSLALDDALFSRLAYSKSAKYIKGIKELFINFNAYEPYVFLTTPSAYPFYNMYSPNAGSHQDHDIDAVVDRLLAVIATLNCKPNIRYYSPPKFVIKTKKTPGKTEAPPPDAGFKKHIPSVPSVSEKIARAFEQKYSKYCKSVSDFMVKSLDIPFYVISDYFQEKSALYLFIKLNIYEICGFIRFTGLGFWSRRQHNSVPG
ncbi:Syntaxin-binding protein 2 [Smittium mucronatum]|uniref:Syntaxin-binding protein 2 n=1 Tax=Smittium mucronatum TaxID=133383 RepID=A0A1R0H552_9FUNG|nr:Syntaxin-binding protein 2 [Smittium mucronatum]